MSDSVPHPAEETPDGAPAPLVHVNGPREAPATEATTPAQAALPHEAGQGETASAPETAGHMQEQPVPAVFDELEDEPTTLVMAPTHPDLDDEPTTVLAAQHPDLQDEPTTVVQGQPATLQDEMQDEPTTVLAVQHDDMEEATTVLSSPAGEVGAAHHEAEPAGEVAAESASPDASRGDVTEIRLALGEAGLAQGGSDWFAARLQEFVACLQHDEYGTRRPPQDFQALAMTARDMLARLALQAGERREQDGFGNDTVLQQDQLLANTYIVRSLIARGGVGEIYRARHRDLKTEHAVKVLLPRFALDATMLTLMQDEARLLQLVRHEAVVCCQDLLRDADGRPMIVMDYLRGRTLSARLREGRLSPPELIVLARRLADGLGAIHASGIVHQDISPDNVILAEDSCAAATLIDFGLARRLGTARDMHRNLDFAGKFSWSSPEQLSGRPATVDHRSDLYSLGLMLAAAARGFRLDMGNDLESARATRTTIPSLAGIEQPIAGLIEALLVPSPGARLGSAAEIAPMLEPKPRGWRAWFGWK